MPAPEAIEPVAAQNTREPLLPRPTAAPQALMSTPLAGEAVTATPPTSAESGPDPEAFDPSGPQAITGTAELVATPAPQVVALAPSAEADAFVSPSCAAATSCSPASAPGVPVVASLPGRAGTGSCSGGARPRPRRAGNGGRPAETAT